MDLISVIIPTYNASRKLPYSIDSALNQTYPNSEIIVVDDGSSDDTEQLIRRRYPTVRYIHQPNGGPAKARNTGIAAARGALIAFLDADDLWSPDKLALQLAYLQHHPDIGMVFTENLVIDAAGRLLDSSRKRRDLMAGDLVRNIFDRSGLTTSTVMVRSGVLRRVGGFEEGLITGEDDNLWMRIAMACPVGLIDQPLASYRSADGSLSRTPGNIFRGVSRHLDLIETDPRYAALRQRIGDLIPPKRAIVHLSEGFAHFSREDLAQARHHFRKSLTHNPRCRRALAYLLAAYLPIACIRAIRWGRHALRNHSPSIVNCPL